MWRTLIPLFFQPGVLTRDYFAGRRGRYLPPFRTYLVLSVLFFLIASALNSPLVSFLAGEDRRTAQQTVEIEADRDNDNTCQEIKLGPAGFPFMTEIEAAMRMGCENVLTDSAAVNRAFMENIPVMMLFVIPFAALIMKILYALSHRKYVEHLLFLIHYHAFYFLALTIVAITTAPANAFPVLGTPARIVSIVGWMYIAVYLLIAMRRVYGQRWSVTTMKFAVLLVSYGITLVVALSTAAIYSAVTV